MYMEIIDRRIAFEDVERLGLTADKQDTYIKDIFGEAELVSVPRIICCKFKLLIALRILAQKTYWRLNSVKGKIKSK